MNVSSLKADGGAAPGACGLCGIDMVHVPRMRTWLDRYDDDALGLVFSRPELERARRTCRPEQTIAICLATKEAVGKALGSGLRGISWTDVDTTVCGRFMTATLGGEAGRHASRVGVSKWHFSWAHARLLVTVVAIADVVPRRALPTNAV